MRESMLRPLLLVALGTVFLSILSLSKSEKPICRGNGYVNGSWIERPAASVKKSFYCCGFEARDVLTNNATQCDTKKFEIVNHVFRGTDEYSTTIPDDACTCDADPTRMAISRRETFHWQPTHCDLVRWNSVRFCELLGRRKVLMYGDSLTQQIVATLASMIRWGNGGCAHQIVYGRGLHLVYNPSVRETSVQDLVARESPDIVFLNSGAHLEDAGDLTALFVHLGPLIESYRRQSRNMTFVWRTMTAGHPNCINVTDLLPEGPLPEMKADKRWFQWHLFPEMDRVSREFAARVSIPVLDMSPLYYRADAHPGNRPGGKVDCLHYCAPGPLDLFAQLFLNMLHNKEI